MDTRRLIVATVLGALVLLAPLARTVRAAEPDIATMIANAKTPADHEAIAAYYDQQAAAATKEAEMHRKMEKSYTIGSSVGKGSVASAPQHCAALVKANETAAKEYATLAAAHREMAKAGK